MSNCIFSGTTARFLAGQATLRRGRHSATSQVVSCFTKIFFAKKGGLRTFSFRLWKHLTDYISVPLLNNNKWGKFNSVGICAGKRRVYPYEHGPEQTPFDKSTFDHLLWIDWCKTLLRKFPVHHERGPCPDLWLCINWDFFPFSLEGS